MAEKNERAEELLRPITSVPSALIGKTGPEVAQAVLDGKASPEDAGALLLARQVRKVT